MSVTEHPSTSVSPTQTGVEPQPWEQRDKEIMESLQRETQDVELTRRKNQALAELLRSWREEGDEEEQKEEWEFLRRALDEDRLSDRKLFPCDE